MANRNDWNISIAGECMITRPFAVHDDPESTRIIDLLRNSDLTYAHLEMNFAEFAEMKWPSKAAGGGSFMIANPSIVKELRWAGIDIMSMAHNHTHDFGPDVVLSTRKYCENAGIAVSGAGRDLEEAREPCFVEKRNGRAALVSLSSGNPGYQWAGLPKSGWKGRPGVNMLRSKLEYVLDGQTAEQFKAGARKLGVLHEGKDGEFRFTVPGDRSPHSWVAGDDFEIRSSCHSRDLEGNLRAIAEARAMADLVLVAHHFSTSDGPRTDVPPMFVKEFAHAAIDSGADIYLGHGWHRTMGIEIYKGKPIFYGLGNFFAQTDFIQRVPADSYEAHGHDVDKLPTLTTAAFPLHPGAVKDSDTWWSGAILQLEMRDMKARRIRIHPVELGREPEKAVNVLRATGRGPHTFTEGRPLLATGERGRRIIERYKHLSAAFGTTIEIENDTGIVELP